MPDVMTKEEREVVDELYCACVNAEVEPNLIALHSLVLRLASDVERLRARNERLEAAVDDAFRYMNRHLSSASEKSLIAALSALKEEGK